MKAAVSLALCLAARASAAPTVTGTVDFAVGSVDAGRVHGFAAPGGHFDLGVGLGDLRLQVELDRALWTDAAAPKDAPVSGSFARLGAGLRWSWLNLEVRTGLRLYVEAGLGHQWLAAATATASRGDLELGFGMAQEARLGRLVAGGHFGLRALVASPPDAVAARASGLAPARHPDVALFVVFGGVIGR